MKQDPNKSRIHLRLYGLVQGVGFRWWTTHQARELDVPGYVRNLADGSVEVEAEGSREAVAELRSRLEAGPGHARVDRVETLEPGAHALPDPFATLR